MKTPLDARNKVAALARHRPPDDPDLADARRELRATVLAKAIQKAVDASPPLTAEQREDLARLLVPVVPPRPRTGPVLAGPPRPPGAVAVGADAWYVDTGTTP